MECYERSTLTRSRLLEGSMTRKFNRFSGRFGKPVFTCMTCKRRTRETGQGVDHLCYECYELAGLDNMVNDDGREPSPNEIVERDALLKLIAKKGGNTEAVKSANNYLWPEEDKAEAFADDCAAKEQAEYDCERNTNN